MSFSSKKDTCICAGSIVKHPSGKMVKLIKCSYFKDENGIHSFWYWKEVINGCLCKKVEYEKAWM